MEQCVKVVRKYNRAKKEVIDCGGAEAMLGQILVKQREWLDNNPTLVSYSTFNVGKASVLGSALKEAGFQDKAIVDDTLSICARFCFMTMIMCALKFPTMCDGNKGRIIAVLEDVGDHQSLQSFLRYFGADKEGAELNPL